MIKERKKYNVINRRYDFLPFMENDCEWQKEETTVIRFKVYFSR